MNRHILFVHIPKTAGTSFRIAAQEYFGEENTFFDYSPNSSETSALILENIYQKDDPYALYKSLSKLDHSFLSGHYPMAKFAPLYDAVNLVSLIRDPVQQVLSHYNHYKNYNNYKKGLRSFIKEPRFINLQSRMLNYVPLALCGFIGLTEEYNTSIDIFNDIYGTALKHKYMNVKNEGSLNIDEVDQSILDQIEELNAKDINFYNVVKKQFLVHKELYNKNLPYTYGFISLNKKNRLTGIAFQKSTNEAIVIDIYRNGVFVKTVYANERYFGLAAKNFPRKNFIGFKYIKTKEDSGDGKLYAIVRQTGQKIL